MKTWIIVLTIAFIFLKLVARGFANYIRNDKEESMKYYFTSGATPLGVIHGFISFFGTLVGFADIILIIITVANRLL